VSGLLIELGESRLATNKTGAEGLAYLGARLDEHCDEAQEFLWSLTHPSKGGIS
jgi:hypothetical protein